MNYLKNRTADEHGASSILIIFMMVILVTLGAFAIASANTNFKLSQRYLEWNSMYYDLDAKGEEYLFLLDGKLAEAEFKAIGYLENKKYQTESQTEIPETIQTKIYEKYCEENESVGFLTEIFNIVYMHYANECITEISVSYPETESRVVENDGLIRGIQTGTNIKSDRLGYELCGLQITVSVEPVGIGVASFSKSSVVRAENDTRYRIIEWYEYQI